jgi:hypothetical protein
VAIAGFNEEMAAFVRRHGAAADPFAVHNVLPILAHWERYALSPDGVPLTFDEGQWRPVTNSLHRHIVLAQAAWRYPLLAHLRPKRGSNDIECPDCCGTGDVGLPIQGTGPGKFVCRCGGLGWYPAGSEPGPW